MKVIIWQVNVKMENEIQKFFVEGKTKRGAIGNLKNILYVDSLDIVKAIPAAC